MGVKPGCGELEYANRPIEVLQLALAQVDQREPWIFLFIFDDRLRRLGDEHLATAGRGADPCGAMHGKARVYPLSGDCVASVNADPDPDRRTGWPFMARQCPLDLKRAQHSLLHASERDEKRIPLRIHLMATLAGNGGADQAPVLGQDLRVMLP